MSYNIFSVCFCILLCILTVVCQLDEGAECVGEEDGIKGTCVNLRRCLATVNEIKQRKHPQICSFQGREPIICCTDCELVNDTSHVLVDNYGSYYFKTGKKAADMCLEYRAKLASEYSCFLKLIAVYRRLSDDKHCYIYGKPLSQGGVGGMNAKKAEYPHMALLGYGEDLATAQWLCGGSVISERFILTAAHCTHSNALGSVKYVALGILKRTDPPEQWQQYNVKRIVSHPQYKPPNKYNDIALLEVDKKIKFSRLVLPACLNTGQRDESFATATGWGALGHHKELADTLQKVYLDRFTPEECAAAYPPHRHLPNGYDDNSQSCYGKKEKIIDTCEGDSGGPLQVSSEYGSCIYSIIGVTSYGRQCGFVGSTGMYTKVKYYIPWIESVVWP